MATAVKPSCKRKSTNPSASSSSSTSTSEVTQEAPNRPLLQADIYDEAILEQFDVLGSSGNEGTYYLSTTPSASMRPCEERPVIQEAFHFEERERLDTSLRSEGQRQVDGKEDKEETRRIQATDFSVLYHVPEPYAPTRSVYPSFEERIIPAPPTYREVITNPHAFRSYSTITTSPSSAFSPSSIAGSASQQHPETALIEPHHPPPPQATAASSPSPIVTIQRPSSSSTTRIQDLKYVQCLACSQWLQVSCQAHFVYCPTCQNISRSTLSNTKYHPSSSIIMVHQIRQAKRRRGRRTISSGSSSGSSSSRQTFTHFLSSLQNWW